MTGLAEQPQSMRDALEAKRNIIVERIATVHKGNALYAHDSITELIDIAEGYETTVIEPAPTSIVQVTSIDIMMALLDDKLQPIRNQLTRALAPRKRKKDNRRTINGQRYSPRDLGHNNGWPTKRRDTAVRNKKTRVKARTAQRKLKRGTR